MMSALSCSRTVFEIIQDRVSEKAIKLVKIPPKVLEKIPPKVLEESVRFLHYGWRSDCKYSPAAFESENLWQGHIGLCTHSEQLRSFWQDLDKIKMSVLAEHWVYG